MTFTTLVKILYGHSVGYDKKKAAFAVDFLRRSGGKHFVSDPAANPDTDTLRRSDLEGVKQLLKNYAQVDSIPICRRSLCRRVSRLFDRRPFPLQSAEAFAVSFDAAL